MGVMGLRTQYYPIGVEEQVEEAIPEQQTLRGETEELGHVGAAAEVEAEVLLAERSLKEVTAGME